MILGSNDSNFHDKVSQMVCENQRDRFQVRICYENSKGSYLKIDQYSKYFFLFL